jgi:hypothetical protein
MKSRLPGSLMMLVAIGISVVVLAVVIATRLTGTSSAPAKTQAPAQEPVHHEDRPASLDCAFHDFMRTHAVVSFYFDVALAKGLPPRFLERTILLADGTRKTFAGSNRPEWNYALDEDGKPTITSPDAATRIVLFGLKLGTPGVLSLEAGVRSNEYRNLGGECRQTNLGG